MKTKRLLAGLLTLVMLMGLLPSAGAFVREEEHSETPVWEDAELSLSELPESPADADPQAGDAQAELLSASSGESANQLNMFGLINVAPNAVITHAKPCSGSCEHQTKWTDNDLSTDPNFWAAELPESGNEAFIDMDLQRTYGIRAIQLVGRNHGASYYFTCDVLAKREEADRWTTYASAVEVKGGDTTNACTAVLDFPTSLRYIRFVLHGDGTSYGGVAEVRAYAQYENVASNAIVTHSANKDGVLCDDCAHAAKWTDGDLNTEDPFYGADLPTSGDNVFIEMDLQETYSVNALQLACKPDNADHFFTCDILTKGESGDWVTQAANVPVRRKTQQHAATVALSEPADVRYVKFVLHRAGVVSWASVADLGVFTSPSAGLVNIAPTANITTAAPESGKPASNLVDGDLTTLWVKNGGGFPTDLDFSFGNKNLQRIEIFFEKHDTRSVKVALAGAINGITEGGGAYASLLAPTTVALKDTLVRVFDTPRSVSDLKFTLSDPKDGTATGAFWPAVAEVRIWAEDKEIRLDDYTNITERATTSAPDGVKEWDFNSNQQVIGFRLADLPAGASVTVKAKAKRDSSWTTYSAAAGNGDLFLPALTGLSRVRVEGTAEALAALQLSIFGKYVAPPAADSGSVAYDKPVHGSFNNATAYLVNDGSKTGAGWTANLYPAYVDIDLEGNYDVSAIEVYTPTTGYTEYTLYTSIDGRDFDLVAEKLDDTPCTAEGISHTLDTAKKTRYVRVYLEYYSQSNKPVLNEVRVIGQPSADMDDHTVDFTGVTPFAGSQYDPETHPITNTETIDAVKGIIERQVGQNYVNWFALDIQPAAANGYDYFTLTDEGGKIKVTGNSGVSLATGVNHYLKYLCKVHISQVGKQVKMPDEIVPIEGTVHKETKFPVRYAYNYCTHSYTMSFWNETEWQNELDWLALNGVNVVLDITGQEEVWREFLMSPEIGYTHQEAKDFLAGPGYYAWAYMANLTGFGGPVHDSFLTQRTELARKNQRFMRALGMQPVLQGFSGMVPTDLASKHPELSGDIISQGDWCKFDRPYMLRTNSTTYDTYAELFYQAQKKVLGDAKYYATDPFHEGGNTGGMDVVTVASALLDSLIEFDSDAVWIIQSWQGNPSNALLEGLRSPVNRREHALILDLYAETTEHWKSFGEDTDDDGVKEFTDTPWVWCQLNNFGGRMGLNGYLENLQKRIPAAANSTKHMAGIGITPEASMENPLLYDFLFETIWTDNAAQPLAEIDLDQWLKDYARRRYGAQSDKAEQAMTLLLETVYNSSKPGAAQGAPESVVNARPALSIGSASSWGYSTITYDKKELQKAAQLLLEEYDLLSGSDAYLYDLADILKQVLSNTAQELHSDMADAYSAGNKEEFTTLSDRFLTLIDLTDQVLSTRKEFLLGTWTGGAVKMAENTDDFTNRLYLRNAKALITTWGPIEPCERGGGDGLKDYSNRQWAGLTKDYYKDRWTMWIDQAKTNLNNGNHNAINITWFPIEWKWARGESNYADQTVSGDLKALGAQVKEQFFLTPTPAEDDTNDLPLTGISVKAGSQETSSEQAPASNVLDGDTSTFWHTQYSASVAADKKWIAFDLGAAQTIGGLRYLPRQNPNGRITQYELYVSSDSNAWDNDTGWTKVTTTDGGVWSNNLKWKKASFDPVQARYVKLLSIDNDQSSITTGKGTYYTAAEIRITKPAEVPVEEITLDQASLTLYTNAGDGHSATLTATVTPEGATNKAVNWSVSPISGVVSVENGLVTAVGNGTATITAASQADPTITATCIVTVKTKITGQVAISVAPVGDPVFGSTLTATLGNIAEDAKAGLSYAWYRGETAEGTSIGTGSSYTLQQADIGQKITLKVTASGNFEGSSTATTEKAVGKAAGENIQTDPTSTPCSDANTSDGKITGLNNTRRYQYQKQNADGSWPDAWKNVDAGADSIDGLSSGNYRVRRWFDAATHTPGSFANVHVGVANVPEYAVNRPNDDGNGNYVRALPRPAEADATVTVTVTTVTGWELTSLTATNDTTQEAVSLKKTEGKDNEYTFTMPASAVTLTPAFAKKSYTITYDLSHAVVDGEKPESVLHGKTFTFTLAPKSEYYALPTRIAVTDADGREVAHTYLPSPDDSTKKVVGFAAGLDRDVTVKVTAEEKLYHIGHHLTNINCDLGDEAAHKVAHKAALNIHLTPAAGYRLPQTVQISMGAVTLTDSDFTYDRANGTISFAAGVITGNLEITAEGVKLPAPLTISASPASLSGGGQVSLTVTVPKEARDAVFDGIDLVENISTQLSVVCNDPAIQTRLTVINRGRGLIKLSATLPNTAKTYTFTASLAANEQEDYPADTATCTVSVTKPGSSSSSGSSSSRPSTSTTTETRDDGTAVTTVTKPDGTVTETVQQPDGTKSETVTTKDGDVTITVTDPGGEELVKAEIPAAIPEPETKFEDVDVTPWAEEAIHKMAGLELVNGTGGNKYSPVAPMTRGSLATVLHRLSQGKTDYETTFKDVAQGKYYTEGVAWAAKANVVKGVSEDVFAPDDVITREQLAVMLARYAKLVGMDTKADANRLHVFADGEDTGDWAVDGVAWCVAKGILKGKGQNNLDPTANVTRAEVAVMLDRFIALIGK